MSSLVSRVMRLKEEEEKIRKIRESEKEQWNVNCG